MNGGRFRRRGIVPLWAGGILLLSGGISGAFAADGGALPVTVAVRGASVILSFRIPEKPAGRILHLSIDHTRLLGRKVRGGEILDLCVNRLPPGPHLLGYDLAGRDQVVRTEERFLRVEVPAGAVPTGCPAPEDRH